MIELEPEVVTLAPLVFVIALGVAVPIFVFGVVMGLWAEGLDDRARQRDRQAQDDFFAGRDDA